MTRDHRNDVPPTPDAEGKVWLTLHSHTTSGVELGHGASINPGETKLVPLAIAQQAVAADRGRYAEAPEAA